MPAIQSAGRIATRTLAGMRAPLARREAACFRGPASLHRKQADSGHLSLLHTHFGYYNAQYEYA